MNNALLVSLYVDDLIYIGNYEKMIKEFKENVMNTFKMMDLALMHYLLGIETNQSDKGIFISRKKYIKGIIKTSKMSCYKTIATPIGSTKAL